MGYDYTHLRSDGQGDWYARVKDPSFGELPAGEYIIDRSTNALKVIPYEHYEIHAGSHYQLYDVFDLPADDWIDMRFVTADTAKWPHFDPLVSGEAGLELWIYEGVTINAAGTAVTPINRNRNSANTSGMTMSYVIATTEAGLNTSTAIAGANQIGHAKIGSGKSSGGDVQSRNENMLKQNTAYTIRIHSLDNSATRYVNFQLTWYEHTNKI